MNRRPVVGTIGEVYPPVGICGTGFICAIAELKKNRLLDSRGSFVSPYDEEGYPLWRGSGGEKILISQKDIRQFQLAKAAIRAGIEKLLDSFGCTMKEVSHLYFAGGFGTKLPVEEAIAVGLLPGKEGEDGFSGEIHALGNSSLRGAIRYGLYVCDSPACPPEIVHSDRSRETKLTVGDYLQEIREKTRVISLAEDEDFGSRYFTFLDL
jgi:hypothetical protein